MNKLSLTKLKRKADNLGVSITRVNRSYPVAEASKTRILVSKEPQHKELELALIAHELGHIELFNEGKDSYISFHNKENMLKIEMYAWKKGFKDIELTKENMRIFELAQWCLTWYVFAYSNVNTNIFEKIVAELRK